MAPFCRNRPWLAGYLVAGSLLFAAIAVNILSSLHDSPPNRPAWLPVTWETTSFAGALAMLWIVFAAQQIVPLPTRIWGRAVLVNLAAASAFSAGHCCVMWTLRRAVYTIVGRPYGWSVTLSQVIYEYRKDLLTYGIVAVLYWGMCRLLELTAARAAPEAAPVQSHPAGPNAAIPDLDLPEATGPAAIAWSPVVSRSATPFQPMLDIRDGAKLVRAPVADILAAEAAGNYVAIFLQDGSQPLMRTTMTQLASLLAPHGFIRVHRSWVVNPAHLRTMQPTRAGDYRLTLAGGVNAPLSRRYATAAHAVLNP